MGKNYTQAPDYAPLANASREAAEIQAGLGREQLAFSREQYNRNQPILEGIANNQIAAQQEQMDQARDYYNYQRDTFRPVEQGLVRDAQRFNTDAYRNDLASRAAADVGVAFNQTQGMNQRAMGAMGVNPNSGRFAGMQNASALQQSAARANAMTSARTGAEQMGYSRQLGAVGLGRNLGQTSLAAYGGASQAGGLAGRSAQSAGTTYMAGLGQGAGTIGAGQRMQLQGLGNVLNNQTQTYINTNDSFMGDLGGVLGGAAGVMKYSDRRLKENIIEVGVDQRTALTLYAFNYKGETEGRRFVGVMADEVELVYPDAVRMTDLGFLAVDYDALGIEFKELEHGA